MLKKVAKAALLVAFVGGVSFATALPAQAQTGFLCGFASVSDPTSEGDVQTGEVDGGPLFAADVDNPGEETAVITITCTIQVGATGATHAGPDAASASSGTSPGVAILAPTVISYVAPEGAPVFLCSTATVNGQVRYYDSTNSEWSLDPSVDCALAISQETPDGSQLDPTLCPVLTAVSAATGGGVPGILTITEDGDVLVGGILIWDCPPYES